MSSDVSVILPVRGNCEYIDFTLKSILKSTLHPDEVLVIDDGISSDYYNVIKKYSLDLNLKIIKNNGFGLVKALNTGLNAAACKYIARIDSDDLMTQDRIAVQRKTFDNNPKLVVVGSQCKYIDTFGNITGVSNYPTGILNQTKGFDKRCLLAHPSTMFLKSAALHIGGYRSIFTWDNADIAEDFDFWLRMRSEGQILNLDEPLTFYRQHINQLSVKNNDATILGTTYVKAVNTNLNGTVDSIHFIDKNSPSTKRLLSVIFKKLGFKNYIATMVYIQILKKKKSLYTTVIRKIIYHILDI